MGGNLMKKNLYALLISIMIHNSNLNSFQYVNAKANCITIMPQDGRSIISSGYLKKELKKSKIDLINVLNESQFNDCRIKGSKNVPIAELEKRAKKWKNKDKKIVVYCASNKCPLSARASKILRELGFTQVYEYEGGLKEWINKGYPTEGPCKMKYLYTE